MRRTAALFVVASLACRGGDREGLTADSAALQSGMRSDSSAIDPGVTADSTLDSPSTDSVAARPTMVLLADSAEGDVLYRRKGKCLSCHGVAGKGLEGLGANLQDAEWLHGDGSIAFIERTIAEGIARPKVAAIAMPALASTLTPIEIYRVAAYVYALSHPGAAVADTTRPPLDTLPVDTGAARIPPLPPPPIPPTFAALPPD